MLHTGTESLTYNQVERLDTLLAGDAHVEVEITWPACPRMIECRVPANPTGGGGVS